MTHLRNTLLLQFLLLFMVAPAQDAARYRTPPRDIMDLVLARPTPSVAVDDKARWMLLLERSDFPSIEELAQPELRIAGLRINPGNFSPSRTAHFSGLRLREVATGREYTFTGLPEPLRLSNLQWSPDQTRIAFLHTGTNAVDLFVASLSDRSAKKVNVQPLNTVLGTAFLWTARNELIYKTVLPGAALDARPPAPSGPVVQENAGRPVASRTYQDLIRNSYEEALFAFYGMAQL
ncbi:MAG TPA: hypothetical protein VHK69_13325, partial [Chitinophagaceae bacterium]|nr:hypothetical protein [Chitinophagaceae bacterium]